MRFSADASLASPTPPIHNQDGQSRTRHQDATNADGSQEEEAHRDSGLRTPENEPLLQSPRSTSDLYGAAAEHAGSQVHASDEEKSLPYLILLTLAIGGLQTAWSVELGSITPFLQELGLSKALLSLVWIAGPLSGTLVQPWVGIKSDNFRSKYGRRKPFMVGGAIATSVSLLALAWTRDIVGGFLGLFGLDAKSRGVFISSQVWAILLVYVLDFSINAIQAGIRAFIVDCVPSNQQEKANAVAGVVSGIGGIAGFLLSGFELVAVFSWVGDSQFKILCVLSCVAMLSTLALSCLGIKERDAWSFGPRSDKSGGLLGFFKSLYHSVRSLPEQVKTVCIVQVFVWICWFPFLFYTTTFVGNLYAQPALEMPGHKTPQEIDDIYEEGTRWGSRAMFVFSVTTLIFSVVLPTIVTPTHQVTAQAPEHYEEEEQDRKSRRLGRVAARISRQSLKIKWLTLRRAWMLSHITLAVLMWLTLLTRTPASATVLVGLAGFPWAMTQWAPFAFIAAEISARDAERRGARSTQQVGERSTEEEPNVQAGIVLGIHNVAVAAPQVVATLASSLVFKVLQKPRGEAGDDSTGWVLRMAGLSALAAAWCTRRIGQGSRGSSSE